LGLQILAVMEVYNGIAQGYYGIGRNGTRLIAISTGIGILIGAGLTMMDARSYSPWLFLVKRNVAAILVIFLLCIAWILLFVRATIRPNVVVHCRILTLYLTGIVFGYFGANIGVSRVIASMLMLTVCLVCLLLWAILLHRGGEIVPYAYIMTEEEYQENQRQKQALLDVGRWLKPPFWRRVKMTRAAVEPLR
jgi:Ca2+/Na+ antiporter